MTITKTFTLEEITCGGCGIVFALPSNYLADKRSEAGSFHCPNGCKRGWSETDADRLRKQLEEKSRELVASKCETMRQTQLREQEHQAREKAEKKLKRVKNGVCPDCKRNFCDLARHMLTKHGNK